MISIKQCNPFLIFLGISFSLLSGKDTVRIPFFFQEKRDIIFESQPIYTISSSNAIPIVGLTEGAFTLNPIMGEWKQLDDVTEPVVQVFTRNSLNFIITQTKKDKPNTSFLYIFNGSNLLKKLRLPDVLKRGHPIELIASGSDIYIGNNSHLITLPVPKHNNFKSKFRTMNFKKGAIRQIAVGDNQTIFIASSEGLYKKDSTSRKWIRILPESGSRSWALADCRSVAVDSKGRLWFASPQGVGVFDGSNWTLFEGKDGLPYNDFTRMAAGNNGDVWFGTRKGAIHFDGKTWEYRQGKRWLPNDNVNDIRVGEDGSVWIATPEGLSHIYKEKMTLTEKAKYYEDEIDKYHRRTPYEYVLDVSLPKAGDKSHWVQHDSDNDGLWTGMYGAAECFAYATTKDPKAKERAKKAFEALKFLGDVTQGAPISPPPGFVARTILPTRGPDPNIGRVENDIRKQKNEDKLWKVYENRWPKDKSGKWYYKTDTSSDELDGHYFLYGLYYDLVAESEEEKDRVRNHVKRLTDHLIDHDFQLVDHDGRPTRWARFNPNELNRDKNWFVERGLNSLSMLSYLAITYHITGNERYRELSNMLIEDHGYAQNMTDQKFNRGVGTGNHSDDEMAFMAYYHLINYETDPALKSRYAFSMYMNWMLEAPELNPFFNFAFRAATAGEDFEDAWGTYDLEPHDEWLDESIETLIRFPLDRFDWRHTNSHRTDVKKLHPWNRTFDHENNFRKGYRVNGKVFPIDESHVNHWNHDPWFMDTGGSGRNLSTGTVFLLPYYMGLYHGFIQE